MGNTKNILEGLSSKPFKDTTLRTKAERDEVGNPLPAPKPSLSMNEVLTNCLTRKDTFDLTPSS